MKNEFNFNAQTTAAKFRLVEVIDTLDETSNSTELLDDITSFTSTLEQRLVFQIPSVYNLTLRFELAGVEDYDLNVTVDVSGEILVGGQAIEIRSGVSTDVTDPVVSGGRPPLQFSLQSGVLPNGLSLNTSSGAIQGAATEVAIAFTEQLWLIIFAARRVYGHCCWHCGCQWRTIVIGTSEPQREECPSCDLSVGKNHS